MYTPKIRNGNLSTVPKVRKWFQPLDPFHGPVRLELCDVELRFASHGHHAICYACLLGVLTEALADQSTDKYLKNCRKQS
jgi:hypothetical protein